MKIERTIIYMIFLFVIFFSCVSCAKSENAEQELKFKNNSHVEKAVIQNAEKAVESVESGDAFHPAVAFADINGDGTDEMFVHYYKNGARDAYMHIFDVFDVTKELAFLPVKNWDAEIYSDLSGETHVIFRSNWWASSDNYFSAFFDFDGESVSVPLCAVPNVWYENDAEFMCNYSVYANNKFDPSKIYEYNNYGFILSDFCGNFDEDITENNIGNEEITMLRDEYVFKNLTYISDIEELSCSSWEEVDFYVQEHYEQTDNRLHSLTLAACANTANTEKVTETAALTTTASQTTTKLTTTQATVTTTQTAVETTEFTLGEQTLFDENDETAMAGLEFAEAYAEMYWNYLCGAAWDDYINIPYFDFDDKSGGNYFEDDKNTPVVKGITFKPRPYFKLLITDYTYDELIAYIKSFYSDELFDEYKPSAIGSLFTGKDNCIYVNGFEPTFIYQLRNEHAHTIGYTENDDGSVTYNCFAKTTEEYDDDLYFSFTLNTDGKLCADIYEAELGLFSDTYYSDDT